MEVNQWDLTAGVDLSATKKKNGSCKMLRKYDIAFIKIITKVKKLRNIFFDKEKM